MNRVNPSFMVGAQTLKNPWFKIKILETCSCHRNDLHRLKYRYPEASKDQNYETCMHAFITNFILHLYVNQKHFFFTYF